MAGLMAAVTAGPPPAGAAPATPSESGAFAEDVALVAARTGWGPAATAAHLQVQQKLGGLADQLARMYPARYAGARLAAAPGGTSELWFKGEVPPVAAELAALPPAAAPVGFPTEAVR
jgi:hypothetical protein